jgi:hypothetical protein
VSPGDEESNLGLGRRRGSPMQASGREEVDGDTDNQSLAAAWG